MVGYHRTSVLRCHRGCFRSWPRPAMSQVAVSSRGLAMRQPNSFGNTSIKAERIFLLSPANIGGIRGSGLMSGLMQSDLGLRLRNQGAPLGEIFSFISGLYFRGKLAYSQTFAKVTGGTRPVYVITASARPTRILTAGVRLILGWLWEPWRTSHNPESPRQAVRAA